MSPAHRARLPVQPWLCLVLATAMPAVPAAAGAAPPSASVAATALADPALRCESPQLRHDRLNLACIIDAGTTQRVQITVDFTGSHDDTNASLEVSLGDTPVACEDGSKTSTEGEDGDVTLDCRFTVAAAPGTATALRASAKWFHARYVKLEARLRQP
jgi:hypothetical protein